MGTIVGLCVYIECRATALAFKRTFAPGGKTWQLLQGTCYASRVMLD